MHERRIFLNSSNCQKNSLPAHVRNSFEKCFNILHLTKIKAKCNFKNYLIPKQEHIVIKICPQKYSVYFEINGYGAKNSITDFLNLNNWKMHEIMKAKVVS